jgi:hypothetical protein
MNLRDELAAVPAEPSVRAAIAALDGIQTLPRAEQVAGVFVLAHVLTNQLGLDVSDLMQQSQRRYDFAKFLGYREGQALTDYVNGELR